MKRLRISIFSLCAALGACLSGGGGSDTETLTGVVEVAGTSIPQARVKLIPSGYNPADPGMDTIRVVQSDNQGNFRFDGVRGGYYNLIAVNLTGRVAFAESLRAGDTPPTLDLARPLTWFIGLHDSAYIPPDSGIVYFPGTDILARCDGMNDVAVDSIPAGLRRIRAESRGGWSVEALLAPPPDSATLHAGSGGITVSAP